MTWLITTVVRLVRAGERAYARKWSFIVLAAIVFLASVFVLARLDLLPEVSVARITTAGEDASVENKKPVAPVVATEYPLKIEIPRIGLSTEIVNPTTTDIEVLDSALLSGAVRYPTSALLGETGNVVLFAHSSYLPVVGNKAYKAFNDIQKLKSGDVITVYATTTAYTYRVRTVEKEDAETDGIPLGVQGRVLTLSTCDSFGKKTDRYVVTADFVDSHSILL